MNLSDLLAITLLGLSVLVSCSPNLTSPTPAPDTPTAEQPADPPSNAGVSELLGEVTIKGEPDSYPASCPPETALNTLEGFLTAFNAGHQEALKTYFPPGTGSVFSDSFRWFSHEGAEGGEPKFVATDPTTLLAYFAARHEQGEAMRITRLEILRPATGAISFNYTLHRMAADLGKTGVIHLGKGAIRCADKTFITWSMEKGVPAGAEE